MKEHERRRNKLGGFMCKLLRHQPNEFNLAVDEYGYCEMDDLLASIRTQDYWRDVTEDELRLVVDTCQKQRYTITETRIKANYGHSIPVIQEYQERELPNVLIHGTNEKALEMILGEKEGIKPMNRQFVHLSETTGFAELAAKRRKDPLLLNVSVEKAQSCGTEFHYAGNEVWLATAIPAEAVSLRKN